jgi:hypothetical protein
MKYVDKMGPDAMIYIQSLKKVGSGIQTFIERYRQQRDSISLLLVFQNKGTRLKIVRRVLFATHQYNIGLLSTLQ